MSQYDLLISLSETTLNQTVATLCQRQSIKNKLLKGNQQTTLGEIAVTVGWEVQQVCVVHLTPPSAQQWQTAIKGDKNTSESTENTFVIDFPRLKVTRKQSSGELESSTTSLSAICTLTVKNNKVRFQPIAADVDLSQASDFDRQFTYPLVIIPQILKLADSLLAEIPLPKINFQGIQFGSTVVTVGNKRLALVANLLGKATPERPSIESLPDGVFYVLLSQKALQKMADQGVKGLRGKSDGKSGQESFGIGKAQYNARIRLDDVSANLNAHDLTTVKTTISTSISASAGVDVLSVVGDKIVDAGKEVGEAIKKIFPF